jgi:cysteinyl-tRNA synthetase
MGEPRFHQLSEQLPSDVSILGIDEHTACIINLYTKEITIKGLGQITLRNASGSMVFDKGDRFPLNVFQGAAFESSQKKSTPETIYPTPDAIKGNDAFWDQIHSLRNAFQLGLNANDLKQVTNALLEMDSTIWRAHGQKESEELISQARELLRDSLVDLGSALSGSPISREACLSPLIRIFVDLREVFRKQKKWHEADEVRSSLSRCGVIINDTPAGPRWQLTD